MSYLGLGRFQLLAAFVGSVAGRWTWSAPSGNRTPGPGPTRQSKSELCHFCVYFFFFFFKPESRNWKKNQSLFVFLFSIRASFPSYVVAFLLFPLSIHELHPDDCWGFLLPLLLLSCLVFILTPLHTCTLFYCCLLLSFLSFFFSKETLSSFFPFFSSFSSCSFGMWRASCLIDWNWRRLPFSSWPFVTDQTGGVCREDQRIVRRDDRWWLARPRQCRLLHRSRFFTYQGIIYIYIYVLLCVCVCIYIC